MTQHESDVAALEAAGKKQVLKVPNKFLRPSLETDRRQREWNFIAVLAMSSCTLCTWEATSALFAGAFLNGGPASVVYGFIVATLGTLAIAASMAEMASMYASHRPPLPRS